MYTFEDYRKIIQILRSPEGCPWDRKQTHDTLIPDMTGETAEAIAAIEVYHQTGNAENLCEELGDLLLLIMMQSQIAQEEGIFAIEDVIHMAAEKMIRRHPHVFAPDKKGADWESIKQEEKKLVPPEVEKAKKEALVNAKQKMKESL